jgi:hypothetical protein
MPAMRTLLLTLLIAAAMPSHAGPARAPCAPAISGGWVRLAPGMPMGAGFGVIRNTCRGPIEITGVHSSDFADASLHETRIEGGMSRMRAVTSFIVPVGRTVELRPGGLHLMLMEPRRRVAPGERVRVEFLLRDGRRIAADLPVRATAP